MIEGFGHYEMFGRMDQSCPLRRKSVRGEEGSQRQSAYRGKYESP
jgi:hypothetical protein